MIPTKICISTLHPKIYTSSTKKEALYMTTPFGLVYDDGDWMSPEYIGPKKESTIHLLPDTDQKFYHEAKKELQDFVETNKNICDKCIHKNAYILKEHCSKIYLPINDPN